MCIRRLDLTSRLCKQGFVGRTYLHFHFRVGVDIANETLIIGVLVLDFPLAIVAEVVPQRDQEHIGTEQLGLLSVLISKHLRPTKLRMVCRERRKRRGGDCLDGR